MQRDNRSHTLIDGSYVLPIDLAPGYTYPWPFTIHVDVQPLTSAIGNAAQAAQLRDALASMSPAVLAYRALGPAREPLLAWLDKRAQEMMTTPELTSFAAPEGHSAGLGAARRRPR